MNKSFDHYLKKFGILALDIGCILIALSLAYFVYPLNTMPMSNYLIILLLLAVGYNFVNSQNRNLFARGYLIELKEVIVYNIYLLCGLVLIAFFWKKLETTSRLLTSYFFCFNIVIMYLSRVLVKVLLRRMYNDDPKKTKGILMVVEKGQETLLDTFRSGLTYNVIGTLIVNQDQVSGTVDGNEISCPLDKLVNTVVTYQIDDVVFKLPGQGQKALFELITDFEDMGANCHYALDVPTGARGNATMEMFGEMFMATYTLRTQSTWQLVIKRVMDICGAVVGLILCGIISIFLIPAIKLDSPGPAIFSQIRIGKNGRRFKFYKFRSMYVDAEERKKELMKNNEMDGLMFKMEDDPRITKVGKFIRKTSLDEFPQFWNVLIGDMSLVGTRPPTEDEFNKYNGHYKRRLMMTPGITGLWQVSGRSSITDFDEVVKLDLEYIDNWSLLGDIKILFKTVISVIKRDGAE